MKKLLIILSMILLSCDCMICEPERINDDITFICQKHHDSIKHSKRMSKTNKSTSIIESQRAYDMSTKGNIQY